VFRFPKREERREWLDSELRVLGLLRRRSLGVTIPVPAYVGSPSPRFPCRFMGYRLIAGMTGDRVPHDLVDQRENAQLLGELLTAVHSIDPQEAAGNGVKVYDQSLEEVLAETASMRPTVLPTLPSKLRAACDRYLDGSCVVPAKGATRRCLVHGDLVDEHVIVDDRGRVSGVIDWGDAGLSDPTGDFGGLYAWLGPEFVRQVLVDYGQPWDELFFDQIAFRARCFALINYGWSLRERATTSANRLPMVYTAFGVSSPPGSGEN
jgi:aminoglycoside phosphotransferase (APT) family kinase protein